MSTGLYRRTGAFNGWQSSRRLHIRSRNGRDLDNGLQSEWLSLQSSPVKYSRYRSEGASSLVEGIILRIARGPSLFVCSGLRPSEASSVLRIAHQCIRPSLLGSAFRVGILVDVPVLGARRLARAYRIHHLGASDNIATARRTRTSLRAQQQITSRYVSLLDPALLVDHATTGSRLIQRLLDALEGNHRGQNILYSAHRSVPHESRITQPRRIGTMLERTWTLHSVDLA